MENLNKKLNKYIIQIINDYAYINWEKVLKDIPECDWPIESAICAELFDGDDLDELRKLLSKVMKKMTDENQFKYLKRLC